MERWSGRVALVTGASSGIGASVARRLVAEGMKVVAAARRMDTLQALADELKDKKGKLIPIQCDITQDEQVMSMFAQIKQEVGGVDVCINNAGFFVLNEMLQGSPEEWRAMLDLNVVALSLCTKESVASMRERGVDDGHIIHINSISGHQLSDSPRLHFYCATKHMVTVLTEAMRRELRDSNIRVTSISPGMVETEIMLRGGRSKEAVEEVFRTNPTLQPDDITNTLIHVLAAPLNVQVHEVTVLPTLAK